MECNFKAFEKMSCYFHLDKKILIIPTSYLFS